MLRRQIVCRPLSTIGHELSPILAHPEGGDADDTGGNLAVKMESKKVDDAKLAREISGLLSPPIHSGRGAASRLPIPLTALPRRGSDELDPPPWLLRVWSRQRREISHGNGPCDGDLSGGEDTGGDDTLCARQEQCVLAGAEVDGQPLRRLASAAFLVDRPTAPPPGVLPGPNFALNSRMNKSVGVDNAAHALPRTTSYRPFADCQVVGLEGLLSRVFGPSHISGSFVEFGGYDGHSHSNTCFLADLGWRGLYLEPVPAAVLQAIARHWINDVRVLRVAVGDLDGPTDVLELSLAKTLTTAISGVAEVYNNTARFSGYHHGKSISAAQRRLGSLRLMPR